MSDAQRLFLQYIRIRDAGHEPRPAVEQLWPQIRLLPDAAKQSLKANIRQWEQREQAPPEPAPATPTIRRITIEPGADSEDEEEPKLVEAICPVCGRPNRMGEAVCYACGSPLNAYANDPQHTRVLQHTTGLFYSDEFFGDDFVLLLSLRSDANDRDETVYELRPQEFQREIHIGRLAYGSEVIPDIDLSAFDAESRGVSRLHLNLFYDPGDSVIRVVDRASANGTFVNGQRLHRNEVRVLRNGDDIRLGRLVLTAKFYTPDFG